MLKSACSDYNFPNDDILTDAISSFSVIFFSIGEIIGPLYAGSMSNWLGIETTCTIAALITFTFTLIFMIVSGVIPFWLSSHKRKVKVPSEYDMESYSRF